MYKFLYYIIANSITPALCYFAIIIAISESNLYDNSGLYPTLSMFALSLDLGIPLLVTSIRKYNSKLYIKLTFINKYFIAVFFVLTFIIFAVALYVSDIGFNSFYIYPFFFLSCFSTLIISIQRAIYEKSRCLNQATKIRSLMYIINTTSTMFAILGYGDFVAILAQFFCKLPMAFVIYKKNITKVKNRNFNVYHVKKCFNNIVHNSTISISNLIFSGFLLRTLMLFMFAKSEIAYFSFIMETSLRISGFGQQVIQPFIFKFYEYASIFVFFCALLAIVFSFFPTNLFATFLTSALLVTTSVLLQNFITQQRIRIRYFLSTFEILIFASVAYSLQSIFDNIILLWSISQIMFMCIIYFVLRINFNSNEQYA